MLRSVERSVLRSVCQCIYGQHCAHWMGFYDYLSSVCAVPIIQRLSGLQEVASSASWWIPCSDICWISERPNLLVRNDAGRLHCDSGAALSYPDGWNLWVIDGMTVDEQIVMQPETQATTQIDSDNNADRRSIRISRFGWPRYLKESRAQCIDERVNEIEGTREALFASPDGSRRLVATCPTGRTFAMGVPAAVQNCEQAQNWLGGEPLNAPSKCLGRT